MLRLFFALLGDAVGIAAILAILTVGLMLAGASTDPVYICEPTC